MPAPCGDKKINPYLSNLAIRRNIFFVTDFLKKKRTSHTSKIEKMFFSGPEQISFETLYSACPAKVSFA